MKCFYLTMLFLLTAVYASAQSSDATFVRIDFNQNPWNLPVSIPNRDTAPNDGWGVSWSKLDDETGSLYDTYTFDWQVSEGEIIQVVLTPSNYKSGAHDNAMVYTRDLEKEDEPFCTMLWTYQGSQLTFKAPKSMWFEKVAFETYRGWASGGLYSDEKNTNYQHVWGKDSVKVRPYYDNNGNVDYTADCWSGDSVEWSLPECTSATRFHYIDIWLLPRNTTGISNVSTSNAKAGDVLTLDGMLVRRNGKLEGLRKGVYIVDGKKRVIK